MAKRRISASDSVKQQLDSELRRLQNKLRIGYAVTVKWHPSALEYGAVGRKLAEIVRGDTIFIFSSNLEEAMKPLRHGFVEWILSQPTKPYLCLINKLITLYEEQQYEQKKNNRSTTELVLNTCAINSINHQMAKKLCFTNLAILSSSYDIWRRQATVSENEKQIFQEM